MTMSMTATSTPKADNNIKHTTTIQNESSLILPKKRDCQQNIDRHRSSLLHFNLSKISLLLFLTTIALSECSSVNSNNALCFQPLTSPAIRSRDPINDYSIVRSHGGQQYHQKRKRHYSLLTSKTKQYQAQQTLKSYSSSLLHSSIQDQPSNCKKRNKKQRQKPPFPISNEIGCSPAFNYELFDPLQLSFEKHGKLDNNSNNFVFYREAELKHGRIAMIATIGMIIPDFIKYSQRYNGAVPGDVIDIGTVVDGDGWSILSSGFIDDLFPTLSLLLPAPLPLTGGIKAIQIVPWEVWLLIISFIGFLELEIFVPPPSSFEENVLGMKKLRMLEGEGLPGDYGFGYFGRRDKGAHERYVPCMF